ncbi:peptidoglycan-binding domain-containing protein [uncultured Alcanivorax sp.]|uniref:peptidoglycan-binding domain-containing protein n=1 Tax=Alcanivorax sp. IL2 TaxID=3396310 RepID=UPI00261ED1A5|nr:peptidoglycan-binding domain-containing protein [uncultured Alcanivorax sp.]
MKLNRLMLPAIIAALATGCASNQTVQESAEYQSLQSQQQQLEQENQQLRAALSSSEQQPAPAPASSGNQLLPPNAKPGHCYARVVIPETYKTEMQRVMVSQEDSKITTTPASYETVQEQVLVSEAYDKLKVIPATYKTVTEKVLVKEATTKLITKPAEYKTVTEQVLVKPAYTTWKKGRGPIEKIDDSTGEIMCLVEVPAEYRTVSRKELVQPERTEEVKIPAVYKTVTKKVVDQPARTETVTVPAVYSTVDVVKQVEPPKEQKTVIPAVYKDVPKQVKVTDADMEWREILCETNTTQDVVRRLQKALEDKGYDPVWIDGVYGSKTRAAVVAYQKDNDLASGQLTMQTLDHLGVKL